MITAKSASAAVLALVGLLFQGGGTPARAESQDAREASGIRMLGFDVAIDVKTLSLNNNDPAAKGNPLRGSTFIVYGKIFPAGTIPSGVSSFDPNQAGSIGTWICRGVFVADFADIFTNKTAQLAFHTTQLFLLPDDQMMVSTEGFEGNVGVNTHRVVTGGTGLFRGVTGEELQEVIGVNQSGNGLFDLRFTFSIRPGR
jgi:hypothetical protein